MGLAQQSRSVMTDHTTSPLTLHLGRRRGKCGNLCLVDVYTVIKCGDILVTLGDDVR